MCRLSELEEEIAEFVREREWEPFHSPKNLATAVAVEAGELLAHFRWLTTEQSSALDQKTQQEVHDEIGDVMICLLNLARSLNVDIIDITRQKLEKVRKKYPVDISRGHADRHLPDGQLT